MATREITHPLGGSSLGTAVTDFRTGKDADGNELAVTENIVLHLRANAAIAKGDLVSFVVPTATVPLSVKQTAVADTSWMKRGIAMAAATAAGQVIPVCVFGHCLVNVGAGTPVAGDYGTPHGATAGLVAVVAAASPPDATTVVGTVLGVFLGTKDANNLASFFFDKY